MMGIVLQAYTPFFRRYWLIISQTPVEKLLTNSPYGEGKQYLMFYRVFLLRVLNLDICTLSPYDFSKTLFFKYSIRCREMLTTKKSSVSR